MGKVASPLKIRSHHLMCILGFRGLGYSPTFIDTMGKVAERILSEPTLPMTLVTECDIICASCPHNKENKCLKGSKHKSNEKNRDSEVLLRLGVKAKTQITASKAWKMIKERLSSKDMAEICQGCEWLELGYCINGLEKLKTR